MKQPRKFAIKSRKIPPHAANGRTTNPSVFTLSQANHGTFHKTSTGVVAGCAIILILRLRKIELSETGALLVMSSALVLIAVKIFNFVA
jgi:hypothetical protein